MYERATYGGVSRAGATLTVDLGALVENYRILKTKLHPAVRCGAVLKADAYGLGMRRVAPALAAAGCVEFFVAHVDEGLLARKCLPASASIYILNGLPLGAEADAEAAGLTPVLNSIKQVEAWSDCAAKMKRRLQAILQFDTGMSRFGLSAKEAHRLMASDVWCSHLELRYVMTHFACADESIASGKLEAIDVISGSCSPIWGRPYFTGEFQRNFSRFRFSWRPSAAGSCAIWHQSGAVGA